MPQATRISRIDRWLTGWGRAWDWVRGRVWGWRA